MKMPARALVISLAVLPLLVLYMYGWFGASPNITASFEEVVGGVNIQPELSEAQRRWLEKGELIKVTEGVYVAVGYALANSIMIVGPEGVIIVDTTESPQNAAIVLSEFRKITTKPIVAIVHTHHHPDHTMGTKAFFEDTNSSRPDIWGYETLSDHSHASLIVGARIGRGSAYQFGFQLKDQQLPKPYGATPFLNQAKFPPLPNRLIRGSGSTETIAGLNVTFLHIPSETKDQIAVWLADKQVLISADSIYQSYPNIYAIRGTPARPAMDWHASLKMMRALEAKHLVPVHTQPISGVEKIREIFSVYMAAIQFVHDQTVRQLNKGLHPDEIAQLVVLPQSLIGHAFLRQLYGTTAWTSKAIYEQYIGWFSGDVVDLLPLAPIEQSRLMVEMVGEEKLLTHAEDALKTGSIQWALELSSHVFLIQPNNFRARGIRLKALRELAGQQTNPLARNYYLTAALEDHNLLDWNIDRSEVIDRLDMTQLLTLMKYRLKAENADGINSTIFFVFEDTKEIFQLQIIYSILIVDKLSSDIKSANDLDKSSFDAKVTTTTKVWKDITLARRTALAAYTYGDLKVVGNVGRLKEFLSYFQ